MRKLRAIGTAGSASLLAIALLLAPALGRDHAAEQGESPGHLAWRPPGRRLHPGRLRSPPRRRARPPRHQHQQRFPLHPGAPSGERNRGLRVAVRARSTTPIETARRCAARRGLADRGDHAQLLQSRRLARLAPLRHLRRRRPGRWRPHRRHPRIGAGRDELPRHPPPDRPGRGRRRARRGRPRSSRGRGLFARRRRRLLDRPQHRRHRRRPLPHLPRPPRSAAREDRRDSQAVYVGTAFRF